MYCAKHPNVETVVSCGRCGTPVCPKCMVHSDVGVRCRTCSPPSSVPLRNRGALLMGGGALVIGGIVALGLIFGGNSGSRSGFGDPGDYYDDYLEEFAGTVTVETVEDPWEAPAGQKPPAPGRRYVAFEVTIENDGGEEFPVFVGSSSFKLTDADSFAYQPSYGLGEPGLPEGIQLESGERARGWVVFELPDNAEVGSLSYFTTEVQLP